MKIATWIFSVLMMILVVVSSGCYKEEYNTGSDVKLRFSTDTLTFDTVFTTVGSATKIFKVFNDYDQAIIISSIKIENNKNNQFRLNIDGVSGNSATDVEIGANDSIYIFAETKINPDAPLTISPFVVEDRMVFETNGNTQKILLEAWGQNANYVTGKGKGKQWLLSCDSGEIFWDDPKPYVIYGTVIIDDCTLRLAAGARIHIHGGIARNDEGNYYYDGNLVFGKNGKLLSEGTAENPIIIQTDRLEQKYQDINALYNGLYFAKESKGSILEHTTIQNATIGLYLDSLSEVTLKSSKVLHIGAIGIYSYHAKLNAENCLIADIGGYNVVVDYGGEINMSHCTVYNNNRDDALALINNACIEKDDNGNCTKIGINPLIANFRNCMFYGTNQDELLLSNANKDDDSDFQYFFDHCIVRVQDLLKDGQYPHFFDNTIATENVGGNEKMFVDINKYDFRLDTNAIVIDKGKYISEITVDIDGLPRDSKPDLGCYEFIY